MKPIKTPNSDVNLTLQGGTTDNDLPAQRILVYNADLGETEKDARLAFESIWMPDEAEARKLEAGAGVILRVWAIRDAEGHHTQPPVSLGVTEAVVPERELVDKGTVDNAMGLLYGELRERVITALLQAQAAGATADELVDTGGEVNPEAVGLPDAGTFVDLWIKCIRQAVEIKEGIQPATNGAPAAADGDASDNPDDGDDLTPADFISGIQLLVGQGTTIDVDEMPGGGWMVRTTYQGSNIMAQGSTRRTILARLRKAANDAAIDAEHTQKETD